MWTETFRFLRTHLRGYDPEFDPAEEKKIVEVETELEQAPLLSARDIVVKSHEWDLIHRKCYKCGIREFEIPYSPRDPMFRESICWNRRALSGYVCESREAKADAAYDIRHNLDRDLTNETRPAYYYFYNLARKEMDATSGLNSAQVEWIKNMLAESKLSRDDLPYSAYFETSHLAWVAKFGIPVTQATFWAYTITIAKKVRTRS